MENAICSDELEHEIDYWPRKVFWDFHTRQQRWAVIVAHRRCGKTVACINDLLLRAINEGKDNARYAYIAPYYAQAKSIAWDYLMRYSEPVRVNHNISELWVELMNGSRIRLFGGDSPDSLRGNYLDGVIIDEMADTKPSLWGEVIRPLLSDRRGWAVFIGTPKGHNTFYDIYQYATLNPNEWYSKVLRASQTNIIDQEELDDALKLMTIDQYQQEFECSFEAAILGAIYGTEMRLLTDADRITKVECDTLFPVHTAWDLGFNDATAIWWYQVVHGEIRVLDYHEAHGQPIVYYANQIKERPYEYGTHWLPHDARAKTLASGGKSIIEQLIDKLPQKSGNLFKIVPNLGLQDGIQATRMALARTWFDGMKCQEGIECLRQYQREFDEDKKVFRDKPRHDWTSHGADAFRMLSVAWQDEAEIARQNAPIRGITVGQNEVTLEEMWKTAPQIKHQRY
jgi:phage terminase large subunit